MDFTVYSKPNCPACEQAKALLTSKGMPFKVIALDVGQQKLSNVEYITREAFLERIPTARTVPQILNRDQYIGGLPELKMFLNQELTHA